MTAANIIAVLDGLRRVVFPREAQRLASVSLTPKVIARRWYDHWSLRSNSIGCMIYIASKCSLGVSAF